MAKVFILLGIFIVIVYVYSIKKIKTNKERTRNINSVKDFHNNYQRMSGKGRNSPPKQASDGGYRRYVTKYNSSEDYREK